MIGKRPLSAALLFATASLAALPSHANDGSEDAGGWRIEEISSWTLRDTFSFDWNSDGTPDQFIVEVPTDTRYEGIDQPTRLRILLSGQTPFTDMLQGIEKNMFRVRFKAADDVPASPYLTLIALSRRSKDRTLFVTHECASSAPCWNRAYGLWQGTVKTIDPHLDIDEIRDLDGDGTAELVGHRESTEHWGRDRSCSNYNPTIVVSLSSGPSPTFQFSETLSRRENARRGYPWIGPDLPPSREAVVFKNPSTGRLRLVRREEAGRLGAQECFRY